jgi:hypothetical protein
MSRDYISNNNFLRAVGNGALAQVAYLIKSQNYIDSIIAEAQTIATQNGNLEMLKCVTDKFVFKDDLCVIAAMYGHLHIIKYFFESHDHCVLAPFGMENMIVAAASCGQIEILEYIESHGSSFGGVIVDTVSTQTILLSNVKSNNIAMIKYLLSKGYDSHRLCATVISESISCNNPVMLDFLLEVGYKFERIGSEIWNPEIQAYVSHNTIYLKLFIQNNFDMIKFIYLKGLMPKITEMRAVILSWNYDDAYISLDKFLSAMVSIGWSLNLDPHYKEVLLKLFKKPYVTRPKLLGSVLANLFSHLDKKQKMCFWEKYFNYGEILWKYLGDEKSRTLRRITLGKTLWKNNLNKKRLRPMSMHIQLCFI